MNIFDDIKESVENLLKSFSTAQYSESKVWREYILGPTKTHCLNCSERQYKIYTTIDEPRLPEHENCKCFMQWLRSLKSGTATNSGVNGADYWLKNYNKFPPNYITKKEAKKMGWISALGNLDKSLPGKMIGGDRYYNKPPLLPESPGRIWYECDINYQGGYRNNERLIYSNDGLIFKTDNHYKRFIEII